MSLVDLFNLIIFQPILNLLIILHVYLPGQDLLWAVLATTLLIKILLYPLSMRAVRTQEAMAEIEPQVKEIREKHKSDPVEQSQKIMALYKENKVNPWSSMVYPFLQLPILIALFQIFRDLGVLAANSNLYSFTPVLESADLTFLGNPDLTQASWILALVVGLAQYWQQKTSGMGQKSGWQKNMLYFFPFFTFFILTRLSAVLGVYWLINILFTVGQQYYLKKKKCSAPPRQKR